MGVGDRMKKALKYIIPLICVPAVIFIGLTFFQGKHYAFISMAVAILACVPFLLSFEENTHTTTRLTLIAVMTALSIVGRIAFSAIPAFKPVTAMVIITAIYLGSEAGFLTGVLTALISNFYFGQGYWTVFQMFTWGIIGLLAGLLTKWLKENTIPLLLYGVLSGVLYSFLMDLWSVFWMDSTFTPSRYIALIVSSLPFTAVYAVSNMIFLLVLTKPIGKQIERIRTKYGV